MEPKELYLGIGALVREHRKQNNFTQERLAKQINLSRAAVANIEAGRQQILVHQLYGIAIALEIDISALLPAQRTESAERFSEIVRLPGDLTDVQRKQILQLIRSADTTS